MKRSSLIVKVVTIVTAVVVLSTVISNFINSNYLIGRHEEEMHVSNRYILHGQVSKFEEELAGFEAMVDTLVLMTEDRFKNTGLEDIDMNMIEKNYESLFTEYLLDERAVTESIYIYFDPDLDGDVHDIWMNKKAGNEVVREIEIPKERYTKRENMGWFYGPMETGTANWVLPYYNRYREHVSSYVAPIIVNDTFIGIIGMYLNLDNLKEDLNNSITHNGDLYWIYNNKGEIIYHPLFIEGTDVNLTYTKVEELTNEAGKWVQIAGVDYFYYEETLENEWTLVYCVPKAFMDSIINKSIRNVLIIILLSIFILMIPLQLFFRSYSVRLNHIIDTLALIKKGDLSKRIEVDSNDEIGMMAKAINESNDNLLRNIEKKNQLAYYNVITGLPNRHSLSIVLEGLLEQENRENLLLLYVDIDNFRNINELIGYEQGNVFVKKVADILEEFEGGGINLYHTNIDEFVFIINKKMDEHVLTHFSRQILSKFGKNYSLGYHTFYLTVSLGFARYNTNVNTVSDFFRIADIAINEAKKLGRNHSVVYNETMYDRLIQFNTLEKDFEVALKDLDFIVHYQPQIDCITGKVKSVEALVRWQHKTKGLLFPNYFIDYAEKSGLISQLGEIVLYKACNTVKHCQDQGLDISIAVNISKRQLLDNDFVIRSMDIIDSTGIDPSSIEFEITESMITSDNSNSLNKLNQLKDYGIRLSLDDFGTGYSSFNSLNELPISVLKLDKTLIDGIMVSKDVLIMSEAIIELAHKLGLRVIAEGVELKKQVDILKKMECDLIQGYYYSKPISEEHMIEFIKSNNEG